MTPTIRAVQRVELRPVRAAEELLGKVTLSRVGDRLWLHRVSEERPDEVMIAAENGMVNGWTPRKCVFGVVD